MCSFLASARYCLVPIIAITSSLYLSGQQFTSVNAGLTGVGRSSLGWADFDKDGDLDLLITGNQGSGPYVASIYRNDEGVFQNINAGLSGIDNSSVAWGDFDNDNDPDILCTGRSSGSSQTRLYRNHDGIFVPLNTPFPAVGSYASVTWGDVDGDGDLDVLISGNYLSQIFYNSGGIFTDSGIALPALSNCSGTIGDYDNDGDQDVFLMGDAGGWPVSCICRNDNGSFTELDSTGIMPLASGSASWCDYDQDNDLDLLINGFNQYLEPFSSVFRNDGDLNFSDVRPGIADAALGTAAWGDYDNDGDADILITGQNAACGSLSSLIYRNEGNDIFVDINETLEGSERGCSAWADYDNDGDLDLVISGFNGSGIPMTRLYRNESGFNTFSQGQAPTTPAGLQADVAGNQVSLHWLPSEDDHTPAAAITYNVRIGTLPGASDVFTSNTDPAGFNLLAQPGNTGNRTSWNLNLPDGTYYWSVQSTDHGFVSSAFSQEEQFIINTVGQSNVSQSIQPVFFPNPFDSRLTYSGSASKELRIYDCRGKLMAILPGKYSSGINTSSWPAGLYFIYTSGPENFTRNILVKKASF